MEFWENFFGINSHEDTEVGKAVAMLRGEEDGYYLFLIANKKYMSDLGLDVEEWLFDVGQSIERWLGRIGFTDYEGIHKDIYEQSKQETMQLLRNRKTLARDLEDQDREKENIQTLLLKLKTEVSELNDKIEALRA